MSTPSIPVEDLRSVFGERLNENVSLVRYTAARVGGPADVLIEVRSSEDLSEVVTYLWSRDAPFFVLGGGSNVLVSDLGIRSVVVLNKAKLFEFREDREPPQVWAESGANLGRVARRAASKGLSGLEWAAGIPGTVGGAVVGNAGAYDGDIAGSLIMADILHKKRGREIWSADDLEFAYRHSALKRHSGTAVVLSAALRLEPGSGRSIRKIMNQYSSHRRLTQPPGASMGSMFKNPPGDYAGRLIEAAGLKGTRIGDAEVSPLHANFFLNHGRAKAHDVRELIERVRRDVADRFGVTLELEIELVGEW